MRIRVIVALALVACGSDNAASGGGQPDGGAAVAPYPSGPYGTKKGEVLENKTLTGLTAAGVAGKVSYADLRSKRNLIIRVQAAFCGTCRVSAEHSSDAIPDVVRAESEILDVVVRDEDNAAPTPEADAAARWQSKQDQHTAVAIDPAMTLVKDDSRLPRVLVVDPTNMTILADLEDPPPEKIAAAVGLSVPAERIDGRFTKTQWALVQAFPLPELPPPDPTNAVGDDLKAASLGLDFFLDKGFGPTEHVSCQSCHETDRQFTDGLNKATHGAGFGDRNTPTIVLAAWQRWQFWDGRADTLWQQALGPLENETEYQSSRLWVAHRVDRTWREEYEAIFGPMPLIDDLRRFPGHGKPGDPAWDNMAAADQEVINRIFVNVGKAIAAYERTFRSFPNAPDRYAKGETGALTDAQKDGLAAYFKAGCAQCHWGERLTDDAFHVVRFPSGNEDFTADQGRIKGAPRYEASEFRADSHFSDVPQPKRPILNGSDQLGAFKTPALRGVTLTSPYGHGGGVATIETAIEHHRTRGYNDDPRLVIGTADPWLAGFDKSLAATLLPFVQTLDFSR